MSEPNHEQLTARYDEAVINAVNNIMSLNGRQNGLTFIVITMYLQGAEEASKLFAEKLDPYRAFRGYELVIAAAYYVEGIAFIDHGVMESQFKGARELH